MAEYRQTARVEMLTAIQSKQQSEPIDIPMLWHERRRLGIEPGFHGEGLRCNFRTRVGDQFQLDESALPTPMPKTQATSHEYAQRLGPEMTGELVSVDEVVATLARSPTSPGGISSRNSRDRWTESGDESASGSDLDSAWKVHPELKRRQDDNAL